MSKLGDFEFETTKGRGEFETGPVSSGKKSPGGWWWLLIVVALAIVAGLIFWLRRPQVPVEAEAAPSATAPAVAEPGAEAESEEPIELPALDASDELVRGFVEALSSNPRLVAWLATDDLIRSFTASTVNISEGLSPRNHLAALEPSEPFTVRRGDGRIVPSAKSYARYDAVADVVSSLDVSGTVELYHRLEPLVDESFAELGYPGQEFDDVLVAALDHLLAVPIIDPEVELVEAVTVYHFADPDLEELSSAQKQLLRTGPENVRKIHVTLRALRRELLRSASD